MSTIELLMTHPLLERLGWTLLHFLWQGALAALALGAALAALRRASPNARYIAAGVCLLVMALAPVATFCVIGPDPAAGTPVAQPPAVAAVRPAPAVARPEARTEMSAHPGNPLSAILDPHSPRSRELAGRPALPGNPQSAIHNPQFLHALSAWLAARLPWLVAGWMAGVALLSLRLLGGLAGVSRLTRRGAEPAEERWRARMRELARRMGITQAVRLMESAAAAAPLAAGWLRPVILLPASALAGLKPEQLEALIAHELAHIRRHDYLVNLLQTAVETVLFYHPAVWWVSRRMRVEREFCCDDLAARACGSAVVYARALAEMEGLRAPLPRPALAAGGGSLLHRVARLLGRPATPGGGAPWWAGALTLLLLAGFAGALILSCQAFVAQANDRSHALMLRLADRSGVLAKGFRATVLRRADWAKRPKKPGENTIENQQIFWADEKREEVWVVAGYQWDGKDGTTFDELRPGVYRVLAEMEAETGAAGPFCLSEPVSLAAGQRAAEVTLGVPTGSPLEVRVLDARVGTPIGKAEVTLKREDGMPLNRGSIQTDHSGTLRFATVPPGQYTVAVKRGQFFYSEAKYPQPAESAVKVEAWKDALVEVKLAPTPLTREEIEAAWPFAVEGTVKDEHGAPLEGVTLSVNGGVGTLFPVGETVSGADGKYSLRFGPAMRSAGDPKRWPANIPLQAAMIYARRYGYYEKELCRAGGLGMAGTMPGDEPTWPATKDKIVLPGNPYRLDFVMLPAARVSGRMTDAAGKPVAGRRFDMHGPTGPSASVWAGGTTDAAGRFTLDGLPCRPYAFGFSEAAGGRRMDVRSRELDFTKPGAYEVEMVYDTRDRKAPKLEAWVKWAPGTAAERDGATAPWGGRVKGRVIDPNHPEFDYSQLHGRVYPEAPGFFLMSDANGHQLRDPTFEAYGRFLASPEGQHYKRDNLKIEKDGTFVIENLPPASYFIQFTIPSTSPLYQRSESLRKLGNDTFTMPGINFTMPLLYDRNSEIALGNIGIKLPDLGPGKPAGPTTATLESIRKLADPNPIAQMEAARILGENRSPEALEALCKALEREYECVVAICDAIGNYSHDPRAIAALEPLLLDDYGMRREAAAGALKKLGWQPTDTRLRYRYLIALGRTAEILNEIPQASRTGTGNRMEGPFLLDETILTSMTAGTKEWPVVVAVQSVEFKKKGPAGQLACVVQHDLYSWPPSAWSINIELLDERGVAQYHAGQELVTAGEIERYPRHSPWMMPLEITMNNIPDLKKIKKFAITIKLEADGPAAERIAGKNVMEGPFKMDGTVRLPLNVAKGDSTQSLVLRKIDFQRQGNQVQGLIHCYGYPPEADWRGTLELLDSAGRPLVAREAALPQFFNITSDFYRIERFPVTFDLGQAKDLEQARRFRFSVWEMVAGRPVGKPAGVTATSPLVRPAGEAPLPAGTVALGHTADTSPDKRSLGASGHAEAFERKDGRKFIEAVDLYASRYGAEQPPKENFHLYVLNEKFQVLADVEVPYAMIERGEMEWYRLRTPSIEVPEKFYVALNFNPERTKGIYLGLDKNVKESHSFSGLPEEGYKPLEEKADWMLRVHMSQVPSRSKGTKLLADWRPPQPKADPFAGCLEVKLAEGEPDGMQSYGGAGAAIRLKLAELLPKGTDPNTVKLKGFRVYAGRYGSGYDVNASQVAALILDKDVKPLWSHGWPYARFTYKKAWVDLPLDRPVAVGPYLKDGELTVGFDPQATATKGIYWQYRKVAAGKGHSLGAAPGKKFFETPEREWMIKVYFEK